MVDVLVAENLTKKFPVQMGIFGTISGSSVHAVDDVSFKIQEGETFGLVGESGCGKTTVAKLLLRLLNPTEGKIFYNGENIFDKHFSLSTMRKKIQLIFQDPYSSLNPRMTVYD
ncbi:MAG: ATP-binding cassette domain-containing protein, partial [Candidatus Heimdallarchaeota archaeon]